MRVEPIGDLIPYKEHIEQSIPVNVAQRYTSTVVEIAVPVDVEFIRVAERVLEGNSRSPRGPQRKQGFPWAAGWHPHSTTLATMAARAIGPGNLLPSHLPPHSRPPYRSQSPEPHGQNKVRPRCAGSHRPLRIHLRAKMADPSCRAGRIRLRTRTPIRLRHPVSGCPMIVSSPTAPSHRR